MQCGNKRVLILGYGASGKACADFLKGRNASVDVYDDYAGYAEYDEGKDYDFAVVSPSFSVAHRVVRLLGKRGIPILSEPDLAYAHCLSRDVVAVSGTNGKTSVCTILADMLSRVRKTHLVGNIGVPFVSELGNIAAGDAVVVEISSFQLEQSRIFRAKVAGLTTVGEDHLDRHGSAERYKRIKLSLFDKCEIGVRNADDPAQKDAAARYSYSASGRKADFHIRGRRVEGPFGGVDLPAASRGKAFDANYLCAYSLACLLCGKSEPFFAETYSEVSLPHFRNEYVGELAGAKVYNDSKGTNIDATLFALSLFERGVAVILGGSDKGEDYGRLMSRLDDRVVRAYLVGANAADMYRAALPSVQAKCVLAADLESCVRDFVRHPAEVLLFSPASASFDLYSGYNERGECFNAIVDKYR